jgi:chromosomal replication initiator protein
MTTHGESLTLESEIEALEARKCKLLKLARLRREVSELEKGKMCGSDGKVTVRIVALEVCQRFKLNIDQLLMKTRVSTVARPRQIVFYLARELDQVSYSEIGRIFGKDHGTITHGYRSVRDQIETDAAFAGQISALKESCRKRLIEELDDTKN